MAHERERHAHIHRRDGKASIIMNVDTRARARNVTPIHVTRMHGRLKVRVTLLNKLSTHSTVLDGRSA